MKGLPTAAGTSPMSGARTRAILGLWTAAMFAGESLLCICFLVPFAVDQKLSLVSLAMPTQAELFGTVWPYLSLLHVAALGIALGLVLFGTARPIFFNKPFVIYCMVNLAAIFWMLISSSQMYWDYALEFFRLTSLVALALLVLAERRYDPRILAGGLVALLAIPIVLLVLTNMSTFLVEREGRVNAPGLEITSTGHISAIAVLLGVTLPVSRRLRAALLLVGGLSLLQSGSRLAVAFCIMTVAFVVWKSTQSLRKRVLAVTGLAIVGVLVIWFGSLNLAGGERLGTLGDSEVLRDEFAGGRAIGLVASLIVLSDHPLGYVDSDWAIQDELVSVGFPSHTHSHLIQSYLRFGPLALLFWGVLVSQTVAGFKAKSPYAPALIFILLGSVFDYYGFVTKAMLIVFVITALNANHILESRKGVNDSPARLGSHCDLQGV